MLGNVFDKETLLICREWVATETELGSGDRWVGPGGGGVRLHY